MGRAYVANGYRAVSRTYEGKLGRLGVKMLEKLKLHGGSGRFLENVGDDYNSLTQLNDQMELPFKQIAEFIEENPEKVFKDG